MLFVYQLFYNLFCVDDATVFLSRSNYNVVVNTLNTELEETASSFKANKLLINVKSKQLYCRPIC